MLRRWYHSIFGNAASWAKLPLEIKTFILFLVLDKEDVLNKMSLYLKLALVSKEFGGIIKTMKPPFPFKMKKYNKSFEAVGWKEFLLKRTRNALMGKGYSDLIDAEGNIAEREKVFIGCGDYLLSLEYSFEDIRNPGLIRVKIHYKGIRNENLKYNGIIGNIPFFRFFFNYVSMTPFGLMFLVEKDLLILKDDRIEIFKKNIAFHSDVKPSYSGLYTYSDVKLGYNGLYRCDCLYSFDAKPLLAISFFRKLVVTGTSIDLIIRSDEGYNICAIENGKVLWKGRELKNLDSPISCVGNLILVENKILFLNTGEVLYRGRGGEIIALTKNNDGQYVLHCI